MDSYKILFHPKAKEEFDHFDGSVRKILLKQLIKLGENPHLGELLGNKAGLDLTGYRKMYALKKKIRIVYKVLEGKLLVFIIAVGDRDDMKVYRDALSGK